MHDIAGGLEKPGFDCQRFEAGFRSRAIVADDLRGCEHAQLAAVGQMPSFRQSKKKSRGKLIAGPCRVDNAVYGRRIDDVDFVATRYDTTLSRTRECRDARPMSGVLEDVVELFHFKQRFGFVFVGESKVLHDPADDHTKKVFDASVRGKTDQFIYKFRKPGP